MELQQRYIDYENSEKELPRPYEMPGQEWEEKAKRVIQNCDRRQASFIRWFDFWCGTEVFQRNRRERGFLTGRGDRGDQRMGKGVVVKGRGREMRARR